MENIITKKADYLVKSDLDNDLDSGRVDGRRTSDFLADLFDMYISPSEIGMRKVKNGSEGLQQDARMMRRYFESALTFHN